MQLAAIKNILAKLKTEITGKESQHEKVRTAESGIFDLEAHLMNKVNAVNMLDKEVNNIANQSIRQLKRAFTKYSNKEKMVRVVDRLYTDEALAATIDGVSNLFTLCLQESQQLVSGVNEQKTRELEKKIRAVEEMIAQFKTDSELLAEKTKKIEELDRACKAKDTAHATRERQLRAEMDQKIKDLCKEKDQELDKERQRHQEDLSQYKTTIIDLQEQLKRANAQNQAMENQMASKDQPQT